MATSSSSTMATPTAAPATLLRRLSRDAARASKSSSLLGAMVAGVRGSPRARAPVWISRRLCRTTLPAADSSCDSSAVPQTACQGGNLPVSWAKDSP